MSEVEVKDWGWHTLRVCCDCNEIQHQVWFEYEEPHKDFPQDSGSFYVQLMVSSYTGFWGRFLRASRYLFLGQNVIVGDVTLSPDKAREIKEFIDERIKR